MEFDRNLDIFPVQGAANIERSHDALSWAPRTTLKLGIAKNHVRDMARRNDTRDKQQLLQYARCVDDIITLEEEELSHPSITQPKGYNVVFSPPSGLVSTVLPKFFCPRD